MRKPGFAVAVLLLAAIPAIPAWAQNPMAGTYNVTHTSSYISAQHTLAWTETYTGKVTQPGLSPSIMHTPQGSITVHGSLGSVTRTWQGQPTGIYTQMSQVNTYTIDLTSICSDVDLESGQCSGQTTPDIWCLFLGRAFLSWPGQFSLGKGVVRVSWNPTTHATQPYCTPRSSPPDYRGPISVPTSWIDPITGLGPEGFQDWEAIGILWNGEWEFPATINGGYGQNVPGTYPPVLPDCTKQAAGIAPTWPLPH